MQDERPGRRRALEKILIVEDVALIAADVQDIVASCGYEVVGIADSFESAQRLARSQRSLWSTSTFATGPQDRELSNTSRTTSASRWSWSRPTPK